MTETVKTFGRDEIIPIAFWGQDHWSTLTYMDSIMTELGGFQIGFDGRMRQNRRNFRVMVEECGKPKRPSNCSLGVVMDAQYTSRLNGAESENHDDWCCVQDMMEAGFFKEKELQPGVTLHFSEIGRAVMNTLRQHKQAGKSFSNFSGLNQKGK